MKKVTFNPTAEDIQAEIANLQALGIGAYGSKHVILYPRIDDEMEVGGQKIKVTQKDVENATKDLDSYFFPVLAVGPRASADVSRPSVNAGDFVMPTPRQGSVKVFHPSLIKPLLEDVVYGLLEDYDVELVKRS